MALDSYDHMLIEAQPRLSAWDCALDGGIFSGSYAVVGAVAGVVPVDLHIRGCPPRPVQLLEGLLALLESET